MFVCMRCHLSISFMQPQEDQSFLVALITKLSNPSESEAVRIDCVRYVAVRLKRLQMLYLYCRSYLTKLAIFFFLCSSFFLPYPLPLSLLNQWQMKCLLDLCKLAASAMSDFKIELHKVCVRGKGRGGGGKGPMEVRWGPRRRRGVSLVEETERCHENAC